LYTAIFIPGDLGFLMAIDDTRYQAVTTQVEVKQVRVEAPAQTDGSDRFAAGVRRRTATTGWRAVWDFRE
jgi:hypothetical protein